ncbi:helix-turn-helix domain-containing protein [Chryseobacterium caseinilyticum]|uniref:Helix-turn-helix domain-containing protein n=1 Tax=Chryseobacterium caseinilyticum TaxID=2771428 RepID=A0ABR8Z6J7_9FLAO|nr:helix-turn-helix domain-containing protein [Chryseobacterium caseinilyticum]MBD8080918.1 helix-turn-helix domain-containing protein [Chryseobacterium caseinilyticum]
MTPDYRKIYTDLISKKYPEKMKACSRLLNKKKFGMMDVLSISSILTGDHSRDEVCLNQRHRAYDEKAVREILHYQKVNRLNNIQLASHFKLSRNTVAKWKKLFTEKP